MTTLLSRRKQLRSRKPGITQRRKAIIIACTVLVLAGCGYGTQTLVSYLTRVSATCMNQGATVVLHEGPARECVGITDGSFQFVPGNAAMVEVLDKIKAENHWVISQHNGYASIAYLLPISASGGSIVPVNIAAEQLEGAYAAQYYANHVLDQTPNIQLLVASSGTQAAQWMRTNQLIEDDVNRQHLVAVAGIGVSLASTLSEVRQLATKYGIPVVGSSITSDAFDNIANMVRVVPDNDEDVSAILKYIWPSARSAILVEDTNGSDSYDTTLINEFTTGFSGQSHHLAGAPLIYDTGGEVNPTDAVAQDNSNTIGLMPATICASGVNYVLFAGRGRDLATLLIDLGHRTCSSLPITVVTGVDVTDMPITAAVRQALTQNVELEYAGEANPQEWDQGSGTVSNEGKRGFEPFEATFSSQFLNTPYTDGEAMIGYDAMLTSISATRLAGPKASPAGVALDLNELRGPRYVPGATGPINLSASYLGIGAEGSNPVGKPIPILRLAATGEIEFIGLEQPPFLCRGRGRPAG